MIITTNNIMRNIMRNIMCINHVHYDIDKVWILIQLYNKT